MFSVKQFRIVVHLDSFFNDHRRQARVFISKFQKTIADLENHIAEVFGLKNFYLTCENHFLPSAEDVRILHEDEVVWVWPKTPSNSTTQVILDKDLTEKRNKKSTVNCKSVKDKIDTSVSNGLENSEVSEDDEDEFIENKNNKRKNNCESTIAKTKRPVINNLEDSELSEDEDDFIKRNNMMLTNNCESKTAKAKINNVDDSELSEEEDELIERINKKPKINNENKTAKLDTPAVNNLEKSELSEDDDDESSNTTSDVDMHNKNEGTFSIDNTQSNKQVVTEVNNTINNSRDTSLNRSVSSTRSFKVMSSIGALMDSIKSATTQSDDSFVNKNKRKRVRKHRRSKQHSSFTNEARPSVEIVNDNVLVDTAKLNAKSAAVHLRFDDTANVNSVVESKPCDNVHQSPIYNYGVLNEDDFLKYPVMTNTLPRQGDVISFKVLKINENYNPEVSKNIIGKVIDYNDLSGNVALKVLYGTKELTDPQGKFYIKTAANASEDIKEMQWKEFITPRLLFP